MSHDFIKMINDIDFSYGFIYECANLVKNLYDYENYDHLAIKLCSEFIMPIINITKKEHIKEYNKHIKNIIDNLESKKEIYIYMYIYIYRQYLFIFNEYLLRKIFYFKIFTDSFCMPIICISNIFHI